MRDGGASRDTGSIMGSCDSETDSDGDGIFDAFEGRGMVDSDGDGMPDYLDTDSDNDGILDVEESGALGGCTVRNSDDDDIGDFRDNDSDNDGLSDRQEHDETGTSPTNPDTDGDGFDDTGEFIFAPEADPLDPSRGIPPEDFYVVLPYEGGPVRRRFTFGTAIRQADVFFMMDRTGSMTEEESALRSGLSTVVDRMAMEIPDIGVGFGGFSGFGGPQAGACTSILGITVCPDGEPRDLPFNLYSVITTDRTQMLADVALLRADAGGATWASHNEAMFQAATGMGVAPWVPPQSCPEIPDETSRRYGYPCFRPASLPILVVLTDTSSKNGPLTAGVSGGTYDAATFTSLGSDAPATYDETLAEMLRIGARVVGVLSVTGGGTDCGPQVSTPTCIAQFDRIARDTGTVRADGTPIVLQIGCNGTGLGDSLVDAIQYLATETPNDISTRTRDGADYPPEVGPIDAPSTFINRITPLSLFESGPPSTTIGCPDATRCDATQFYDVTPGDNVEFEVEFENRTVMPRASAQIFRATIIVVGNGVAELDEREVVIVVPAGSVPFVF